MVKRCVFYILNDNRKTILLKSMKRRRKKSCSHVTDFKYLRFKYFKKLCLQNISSFLIQFQKHKRKDKKHLSTVNFTFNHDP